MKDSVRFLITCEYRTRAMLIRGVARRILNAGRNSQLAYAQPSLAALVSDIVELKLNMPPKIETSEPITKKNLIMLFLRTRIHETLGKEAKSKGLSATKLVGDIILDADFKQLDLQYADGLENEVMVPNSFNLPSECRLKINKEIAKRMISMPTALGKAEFENVGKIMNEILASHFKIALPTPAPVEAVVDNEQIKFTVFMNSELHKALKEYCERQSDVTGEFISVNATIVKWIEEAAEDELW